MFYYLIDNTNLPEYNISTKVYLQEVTEEEYNEAAKKTIYEIKDRFEFRIGYWSDEFVTIKRKDREGLIFLYYGPLKKQEHYLTGKVYFKSNCHFVSEFYFSELDDINSAFSTFLSKLKFNDVYLNQKDTIRQDLLKRINRLEEYIKDLDKEFEKEKSRYICCRKKALSEYKTLAKKMTATEKLLMEIKKS